LSLEEAVSRLTILAVVTATFVGAIGAQVKPPLKLLRRIPMPQVAINGPGPRNFDALTADVKNNRLFVAAQWHGSVEVYDIKTGKLKQSIAGIGRPLDILYLDELARIYVTDGTGTPTLGVGKTGAVRIYDSKTYKQIRLVDLLPDTDSIAYDSATKLLYVKNGGEDANIPNSFITILKTNGDKVGEIKVDSDTIGDLILESTSSRLFVPETDKKRKKKTIRVIDRNTHEQLASWPDPHSTHDGVMDLDERHHRLFAGEPEGLVTVFDTDTGREVTTLPIGTGMDGLEYDEDSKRIYVTCGDDGQIYVYEQNDPDHYRLLGKGPSGPKARSGTLVPELHRFFTAVPEHDNTPAELLEYEVQ
jgi:DNA-binding beta-propeller fold protein YncE